MAGVFPKGSVPTWPGGERWGTPAVNPPGPFRADISALSTRSVMLSRPRPLPPGFIPPCLPTKAPRPPSDDVWLHEIKHDGFRVIVRKDGSRVKLYSRPGNDLTDRFPLIVEALAGLRSRSCIIDGEAVACDDRGIASFDLIRHHRNDDLVPVRLRPDRVERGMISAAIRSRCARPRSHPCWPRPALASGSTAHGKRR